MMSYTSKIKGIAAEILLQQAIIYYELGDIKKAKENIFKVLNVYKEYEIVRPFLIEEVAIKELLKLVRNEIVLSSDKTLKEYMDYIFSCFEANKNINFDKKDEEVLSSREIEIIILIEEGFSNRDISQKLFVSINTVKTHLLNIYTKLDVHSRTSAVSKAREMGILKK
jgi:LuxR family maltose regulon positive regulatory protein